MEVSGGDSGCLQQIQYSALSLETMALLFAFGKECLEEQKHTYLYKGEVEIPPLSMVDDVVCIAECGYKSVMVNSYMQSKTSTKKLQFGASKCKKNHIGKQCEDFKCHPLLIDTWEENEVKNEETGNFQVEDVCI